MCQDESIEAIWRTTLVQLDIDPDSLVHVSPWDLSRRVYARDGLVHKVTLKCGNWARTARVNDAANEFDLLSRLAGLSGFPQPVSYGCDDQLEYLTLRHIPGQTLDHLHPGFVRLLWILSRVSFGVVRQAARGISHNDISCENIQLGSNGDVWLLDYDQATRTRFSTALLRDIFGLSLGGGTPRGSVLFTLRQYARKSSENSPPIFIRQIHNCLRRIVLGTKRYRFLDNTYRSVYRLAFRFAVQRLSSDKQVDALLIRSGSKSGEWIPGLSDFDFTVLIQDSDLETRLGFLDRFWKLYTRVRWFVPMVTEVDVLSQQEFAKASQLSRGPMMSHKKFVMLTSQNDELLQEIVNRANRKMDRVDHFMDVLLRYEYFTWTLLSNSHLTFADKRLEHCLNKLQILCAPNEERAEDFATIFNYLAKFFKTYQPPEGPGIELQRASDIPSDKILEIINGIELLDGMEIAIWKSLVDIDIWSAAVVVPNEISAAELSHARSIANLLNDRLGGHLTLLNDPMNFGYGQSTVPVYPDSMWQCRRDLFPLERVMSGSNTSPLPRALLDKYVALQYGVWLSCRNDWFKEPDWRERFRSMIMKARLLTRLMKTGIVHDSSIVCTEFAHGRRDLYQQSTTVLETLVNELKMSS